MTPQGIAVNGVVTFEDLKHLAGATGPCITIALEIASPFEHSVRLKNALRAIERKLAESNTDSASASALMAPLRDFASSAEHAGIWANRLILFRSPDAFRYFMLYRPMPDIETVDARFQVRPLLSALAREQSFHVLALSQRNIRLLRCTQHRAEEEDMRDLVPRNMQNWLNMSPPDHVLDSRSAAGPSIGTMKGVLFGTGADRERQDAYLNNFFRAVDNGMSALLRNDTSPLLLAGVEADVAIYRRESAFPRLFKEYVHGSFDGLPDRELHERAVAVVMQSPGEELEKALADFNRHRDRGRVSADAREVIKAAFEGRVEDLFFLETADLRGAWNEATHQVDTGDPREDLLNAAALRTILHRGRAFALQSQDMPVPGHVAALLRF
jgi:hypothetical protein